MAASTAETKLPTGTGDPTVLLRRVSVAGTCTTGVLLMLYLSPAYRFPDGVAPNVILAFFLPAGYVLTYVAYEISARYLCNWGETAFVVGFREAVGNRFKTAACYKVYRTFRGAFLSDSSAPEVLRIEMARSRDVRKQIAYVTAFCAVAVTVAAFTAMASTTRRPTALVVLLTSLILAICSVLAFRVRSLTLGRAYGLAYDWSSRNKRVREYLGRSGAA